MTTPVDPPPSPADPAPPPEIVAVVPTTSTAPAPAAPVLRTSPWFGQLVDDTSMYPPAGLTLAEAWAQHAAGRAGIHGWMLGPLMISSARVVELAQLDFAQLLGPGPSHVGVILDGPAAAINEGKTWADGLHRDCQRLATGLPGATLVQIEVSVPNDANWDTIEIAIEPVCSAGMRMFFEVWPGPGLTDRLARIAKLNTKLAGRGATLGAKLRMGGPNPTDVPPSSVVAGFLVACAALELRVKATAGLAHPIRGTRTPPGFMEHGFVNLLVAAAWAHNGRKLVDVAAVLDITAHARFALAGDEFLLDGVAVGDVQATRKLLWSIGSAQFDEMAGAISERGWID